ncbi:hypothetical protein EVG20_g5695 [Dentipellis fragilis]|uniref:Uncharacterized protein n=1 Tax=Dentipellis fragilis TaxID=205917 RepID=A0A4Y9YRV7_9AGAM|nr:hypothetical protein EVG20_g5695 [Dentipellis fragilis]
MQHANASLQRQFLRLGRDRHARLFTMYMRRLDAPIRSLLSQVRACTAVTYATRSSLVSRPLRLGLVDGELWDNGVPIRRQPESTDAGRQYSEFVGVWPDGEKAREGVAPIGQPQPDARDAHASLEASVFLPALTTPPSHHRHRTIYQPSHTIEQFKRFQMADDSLSEIWKAAIKQYEEETKNNLKAISESPDFVNISSADELLKAIDDKQKDFKQYRERGERIKGALKPILDIAGALAGAAGEGVAVVFPPGKAVFVVVKLLVDATRDVKSRYDAIIDIFEQMESFLRRCCIYVKPNINISDVLQKQIVRILAHLLFIMGKVTKYIRNGYRGQIRHLVSGVFKKNTMQEALTKLDHLTKEEGLTVLAATLDGVRHMGEDVRNVNEGVMHVSDGVNGIERRLDSVQEDAELCRCRSWLSAPDPWINHNAAQEKLSEQSTGKWIFDDHGFVEWLGKPNSSMWLYGMPGGGKSVLCSTIIKMLQDYIKAKASFAVAFFYFDFKDTMKQNFDGLLRSLLRQLSSQSLGASAVLKKLLLLEIS